MESYELIEEHLGKQDLKAFAYPYGAYTKIYCITYHNSGFKYDRNFFEKTLHRKKFKFNSYHK